MDINNYKFEIKQVGPVNFEVTIISPENVKFINKQIRAHPSQINTQNLLAHLLNKSTRNSWAIDLRDDDVKVIKEEKKIETKPEEPKQIISVDVEPKKEDTKENGETETKPEK